MTRRRIILALAALALVLAASAIAIFDHASRIAMQAPTGARHPLLFSVPAGADLSQVAVRLSNAGLISNRAYFEWRVRWAGLASALQAGTYEVLPKDTPTDLLDKIVKGRTKTFTITFVEGTRFADLRQVLDTHPYVAHSMAGRSDEEVMTALGLTGQAAEGWFFPSTYHFKADTSDLALLKRAHQRMQKILDDAWQRRTAQLPYKTPYEALIMASIVEKETARADERPAIAGVFVRRLEKGMKLQTDPTVIYGMGANYNGNIRRADLEQDTPYNTYTRKGLPPTPIALPGAAALQAALAPAPGHALYFVARGDGSHQFSASLTEHDEAVRRFQLRGSR
jgi:UPF0755 protein